MSIFAPSDWFYGMMRTTIALLSGDGGIVLQVFFWSIIWLMPVIILGWYIADKLIGDIDYA